MGFWEYQGITESAHIKYNQEPQRNQKRGQIQQIPEIEEINDDGIALVVKEFHLPEFLDHELRPNNPGNRRQNNDEEFADFVLVVESFIFHMVKEMKRKVRGEDHVAEHVEAVWDENFHKDLVLVVRPHVLNEASYWFLDQKLTIFVASKELDEIFRIILPEDPVEVHGLDFDSLHELGVIRLRTQLPRPEGISLVLAS